MDEVFKKSHDTLVDLVRLLATPIYVMRDPKRLADIAEMRAGSVITAELKRSLEEFRPMPPELRDLIIKTFCDSHSKLKAVINS